MVGSAASHVWWDLPGSPALDMGRRPLSVASYGLLVTSDAQIISRGPMLCHSEPGANVASQCSAI